MTPLEQEFELMLAYVKDAVIGVPRMSTEEMMTVRYGFVKGYELVVPAIDAELARRNGTNP